MSRQSVLAEPVPPADERRRRIEAEPLPANLGALLDAAARDAPDRTVLEFFEDGTRCTFAELRAAVNRPADGLAGVGVGRGMHVAVMLPNVLAFPITGWRSPAWARSWCR